MKKKTETKNARVKVKKKHIITIFKFCLSIVRLRCGGDEQH